MGTDTAGTCAQGNQRGQLLSHTLALVLADEAEALDEIGSLEPQLATVPHRSFPLYPRQLRCLADIAAAFANRPFTRAEAATLSGNYVNGADDPLWQLIQRELVSA